MGGTMAVIREKTSSEVGVGCSITHIFGMSVTSGTTILVDTTIIFGGIGIFDTATIFGMLLISQSNQRSYHSVRSREN